MYCFLLLGIGIYYLPSSLNPVIWTDPFPLPTLTGTLKSNEILMLSKKRGHNQITAPESMAIDSDTGYVFASLNDGRVVCLNEKGTWEADIFMLGAINEQLKSNTSLVDHMKWCQSKAQDGSLPWNVNWEKSCGRPLGLRLIKVRYSPIHFYIDISTNCLASLWKYLLISLIICRTKPIGGLSLFSMHITVCILCNLVTI